MPRYVILTHDHPFPHWDLLLEQGDICRAFRLLTEPVQGTATAAQPLPDHRLHYLDYEGPVGGDRGTVTQWDSGEYRVLSDEAAELSIELHGRRGFTSACLMLIDKDVAWTFQASPAR